MLLLLYRKSSSSIPRRSQSQWPHPAPSSGNGIIAYTHILPETAAIRAKMAQTPANAPLRNTP
jgi:hypothetical protein